MKIRVEHLPIEENEVVLRCAALDDEMLEVLALLKERGAKLLGQKGGETVIVKPGEVFYAEAVDGRTFLYTGADVLETGKSLLQLEALYESTGLVRIGKSQLVNLYRVGSLKSLPNSRIQITLQNGERLVVSRHYVTDFKQRLGMEVKGNEDEE